MDNNNINNDIDTSSGGNRGNRGKFSERLKKIRRERINKKNLNTSLKEDNVLKDSGLKIVKVILALPSVVYTHLVTNNDSKINNRNIGKEDVKNDVRSNIGNGKNDIGNRDDNGLNKETIVSDEYNNYLENKDSYKNRRQKTDEIREMTVSLLNNVRNGNNKNKDYDKKLVVKGNGVDLDKDIDKDKLQREIINLIKKRLVKTVNEMELLQSELYVLNKIDAGDIYLEECREDIKEIKKLLSKINGLKEKYDYLKDNVDFEYMLLNGDDNLSDKILELKDICTRDDIKGTIDDYKILDEYKYLYLKIDKLQEDMIKFEEYKNRKVLELKERDIDFDKFKDEIYDKNIDSDMYDDFVKKQEAFLNELNEKMSMIDTYEKVTYRLNGFNQLLGNSFKYLGLLLVSPFSGLVPNIAMQTIVTKNMIHNLYNNLEWKENRKLEYVAIDYADSINMAINNLDDMSSFIDSTLEDIIRLKGQYKEQFSGYEGSFSGYRDAIKKLNKIENAVLGNKIKLDSVREKMKEKERENNNKLKMVKRLNEGK